MRVPAGEPRTVHDVVPVYDTSTEYRVSATVDGGETATTSFDANGPEDYGVLFVDVAADGGVEIDLAVP